MGKMSRSEPLLPGYQPFEKGYGGGGRSLDDNNEPGSERDKAGYQPPKQENNPANPPKKR